MEWFKQNWHMFVILAVILVLGHLLWLRHTAAAPGAVFGNALNPKSYDELYYQAQLNNTVQAPVAMTQFGTML